MKPCLRYPTVAAVVSLGAFIASASVAAESSRPSLAERAAVQGQVQQQVDQVLRHGLRLRRQALPALKMTAAPGAIQIVHQDITFEPDLDTGHFKTKLIVTLKNVSDHAVSKQEFYMGRVTVDQVHLGDQAADYESSNVDYQNYKLTYVSVNLAALQAGASVEMELDYHGQFACKGQGSLQIANCEMGDQSLLLTGFPIAPYFENDSSYDLHLVQPKGLVSTVSAEKVSEQVLASGKVMTSWHNDRFSDMILVGIGDYDVKEKSSGGLTARSFSRSGDGQYREAYVPQVTKILSSYASQFHSYDYTKMDYVVVSNQMGFAGLAGSSMIMLAKYMFAFDPASPGADHVLAHELGHQWFAYIFPEKDRYAQWLAEGWTEYAASVYSGRRFSKSLGKDFDSAYFQVDNDMYTYMVSSDADHPLTGNMYQDPAALPPQQYVALAYVKGPVVVNTLAHYLGGHEALAKAIHAYGEKHAYEPYITEDWRKGLEAATGKDLKAFFDRWVYGRGYPTYKLTVVDGTTQDDGTVTAKIERSAAFPGVLEWNVTTATGTKVVPVTFASDEAMTTTVQVKLDSPLLTSALDPDCKQLRIVLGAPGTDVNGNGIVDGLDVLRTAWAQGSKSPRRGEVRDEERFSAAVDVNRDGTVNDADLQQVLDTIGTVNEL